MKVLIVGLGLIGSSIALGIKRGHPNYQILAYDYRAEMLQIGLDRKIIDQAHKDFSEAAVLADVIMLCTPIEQTVDFIKQLASLQLKENVLLTDVGSTKQKIVETAKEAFKGKSVKFIGGHPMAGSHKSGVKAADVNLFENAYYVLSEQSLELEDLLSGLHAKFIVVDPESHDQATGQVSHFPHLIASSLMQQAAEYSEEHQLVNQLAAGGFRDMTRIAESDASMWTSILLSNSENIIERIEDFKSQLDRVSKIISTANQEEIHHFFTTGKKKRQEMEIHKGAEANFYDLFISVPDEKGVILRVLALLQDISITNVKINENNREDIHGQLQLTFKNEQDLNRAKEIIEFTTDFKVDK